MTKQTTDGAVKLQNSVKFELQQKLNKASNILQSLVTNNSLDHDIKMRLEEIDTIHQEMCHLIQKKSQLCKPPAPLQLTIDCLPNLPLQRVFEALPLTDQFQNLFVNHNWRLVQSKSFATRDSLTILIGDFEWALKQIKESQFRSKYSNYNNVAGTLPDATYLELSHCFLLEPHHRVDQLVAAFPRVTSLQIALDEYEFDEQGDIDCQCNIINQLLRSTCAANIKSLELYTHNEVKLPPILAAINALPALEKLTIECPFIEFSAEDLHLPILTRLHEFRFYSENGAHELCPTLLQYAVPNDQLTVLEIGNWVQQEDNFETFITIPVELRQKICSLNATMCELTNVRQLNSFVGAFVGLTRLKIYLDKWTPTEVNVLAQLRQLIELNCELVNSKHRQIIPIGTPLNKILGLTSVQYLCFNLYGLCQHQQLLRCHLPHIFANVRLLKLNFTDPNQCQDCKSPNYEPTETCVRQLVQPLKDQFGQLISGFVNFKLTNYRRPAKSHWTLTELWTESPDA